MDAIKGKTNDVKRVFTGKKSNLFLTIKPQSDERQKSADKIGRFLSPDKNRPIFVSHDGRFLSADKMRENGFVG